MKKINELFADSRFYDYFKPAAVTEKPECKCKNKVLKILANVGVVAAVAGIAIALY